jgi:hypothetical protein
MIFIAKDAYFFSSLVLFTFKKGGSTHNEMVNRFCLEFKKNLKRFFQAG